ncbi:C-signal-like [Procambarus clarkii]|uniref:C-signal-like n=1 Tax=Procambarus clarkii TaxID=6728 RepID=UPI003743056F
MLEGSVMITGCSRGLGLEMVRQLLTSTDPPRIVVATCRNPNTATELQGLARDHSRLRIIKFDVVDFESLPGLVDQVWEAVGSSGLNLLINNAGITETKQIQMLGGPFERLEPQMFSTILETNTTAPLMIIKALLPLLRQAAGGVEEHFSVRRAAAGGAEEHLGVTRAAAGGAEEHLSVKRAAVVNISSIQGSMGAFTGQPAPYGYRASKAALNMLTKILSLEFVKDGIMFVAIHPGAVLTDMASPTAVLTPQESISKVFNVLRNLSEKHNGRMISYTGDILPW